MLQDDELELSLCSEKAVRIVEEKIAEENDRFVILVSFEDNFEKLPNNYIMAIRRFVSLCRKAQKDNDVKSFIVEQMKEMRECGFIEPASNDKPLKVCRYLPYLFCNFTS